MEAPEEQKVRALRWGGFFRRCWAFLIDLLVLSALSILLLYLTYVGISVGLAAHNQSLFRDNSSLFLGAFLSAWPFLVAGYFVLLHGMDGRTIGKWLLGLRVVGPDRGPVTYGQAFLRWVGYAVSSFLGGGFLWILWSREKRGWHDLLANTWVIHEKEATCSKD
jgi:uncharacterized RDD family membrane protein YckC